jgi:DNA (cytosine-5)-methyltransferase 1
MLYGLDLFSGIAGNSLALAEYVHNIAYCESDRHAQAVLISRMSDGRLPRAPICTDIRLLDVPEFRGKIDIICAGFPCQDISCAGKGAGLGGERSGLFFQVVRLAKEIQPAFLFLENVPAIRTRGLDRVIEELTALGYDLRWAMLSAAEVGAPHKRERWFLLGHSRSGRFSGASPGKVELQGGAEVVRSSAPLAYSSGGGRVTESTHTGRRQEGDFPQGCATGLSIGSPLTDPEWWAVEPDLDRVVDGLPYRVDRIKRLGNAVVPLQAKTAFEMLLGIKK